MKGIHNPFRKRKTNQNEDLFGDDWVTPNQSMEGIPDQQPTLAEKELAVALKNQAKNAKLFPWLGSVVFGALSILSVAGSVITFGSLVSLDEVCPLVNSGCGQFNRSGLAWFLWFQQIVIIVAVPIMVYRYLVSLYRDLLIILLSLNLAVVTQLIQAFNIASDQIGKDAVTTAKVRLDACSAGFVLIAVLDVALLVMVGTMPGSLLGWLNLDSMPLPFRKKRS